MATTPSWLAGRGTAGLNDEAAANETKFGPRRLWLKPETTTQLVFLDDDPPRFYEHQVCIDGSWQNFATCPGEADCPLCAVGDKPTYVAAWSVLDRSEWKDKKGQLHKDELRVLVAKPVTIQKLVRRSDKIKAKGHAAGLAGIVIEVSRGKGKTSASVGDDFEVVGKASKELMEKGLASLPDYMDVFKPDMKKLARFARLATGKGADDTSRKGGKSGDDDTIAF